MSTVLAIDPGPERSALLVLRNGVPDTWEHSLNAQICGTLCVLAQSVRAPELDLAVEMIASYGMPVGAEVFETCVWIGRFVQAWAPREHVKVYRKDVKLHLCGSTRAKDPNVRQALIDRYGGREKAIGTKATPGPLYGISGDCWSALAVAVTYADSRVPGGIHVEVEP